MAYKAFEEGQCRYNAIKNKKRWKVEFEEGYVLSDDRIKLTKDCLSDIDVLTEQIITRLARLIRWAEHDEVISNWKTQLEMDKQGRKPAGPSKDTFILQYGKVKGEQIYTEFNIKNAERAKKKSRFSIEYWINLGYSEEEAKEKLTEKNRKHSKKRWEEIKNSGIDTSLYTKSINPLSKEYVGYVGMSDDEIENQREMYLSKCIKGKDYYLDKYGEEKGTKLFEERQKKRMRTMLKNETGVFSNKKGLASSWSLQVFLPLCDWIHSLGFEQDSIQMGYDGYRGERWIRDPNNEGRYFLYDFTFLPLNCIIEYHGTRWHPKEDGTFAEKTHLKVSGKEKRKQDLYKKKLAEENGYKVLEIWSDEDKEQSINKCKEFLIEHGILKI